MDVDSSTKFIGSLTKFLQSLCNGYVEFQRGVELVGHIYLSIDTGEKVDYILHEKVSKNDENSVTFVSNSFHAQPLADQDKNKAAKDRDTDKDRSGANCLKVESDDDIMIVDHSNEKGNIPSRGAKHGFSPGSDQRQSHYGGRSSQGNHSSINPLSSSSRNQHQLGPSATVTSQESHQDNISMGDVKLEQLSADELLSLATQVGEGASASSASRMSGQQGGKVQVRRRSSLGDGAGQPVWIKQEPPDDAHGGANTGWPHSLDGQGDSNNSGSNLYPVMMHQNPAFSSGPVFPGFPSMSGPSTSSQHQPLPGTSGGGGLPYGSPGLGSPLDMSGIDPAVAYYSDGGSGPVRSTLQEPDQDRTAKTEYRRQYMRHYRQNLKLNPKRLQHYKEKQRVHKKRYLEKQKLRTQQAFHLQSSFNL